MPTSRLGFHYFPDQAHYGAADLQRWVPRLQSLGAAWLVLRAGADAPIPELFIRGLVEAAIQPVVWIRAPVSALRAKELAPALNSYHRWGVHHVVPGDRPNLRQSWSTAEWSRPSLPERTVDRLLPLLQLQRSIGLRPTFPPLEPGGDYWDTAFLESAIRSLLRRGQHDLVRELTLAVYGWMYGRPLDWGAGGPQRWPGSQPYAPAESSPDQRGIRLFDWYEATLVSVFGQSLPMLVVAGGALDGRLGRDFQRDYTDLTSGLAALMLGADAPANVLCFAFYPLATEAADRDAPFAWFDASGQPRPAAEVLRRETRAGAAAGLHSPLIGRPSAHAKQSEVPSPAHSQPQESDLPPDTADKPLDHYVLLGEGSAAALARGLRQLGGMMMEQRAVIGFSSEQARMAKQVTILGNEQSVPAWIEYGLRQHGCQVVRISPVGVGPASQPAPYPAQG